MSTAAGVDCAPFLERAFLFDAVEDSYPITGIRGEVPPALRGSYYVNGPARFARAGMQYKHWLDGDGMICSVRFGDDGVTFANRFVRTPKLVEEEAAGRFVYRGFGTSFPGDKLRRNVMLEPPVNVSVYPFAGSLLAFGEQTLPYELDPITLETRGEFDFKGKLNGLSPFSAHAKFDPDNGHMLNFGISYAADNPIVNIYEFDRDVNLIRRRRHPIRMPHSNHDFGFTANWVCFYLSPLLMNFPKFWSDRVSVQEALTWEPEKGSRILLVPRSSKDVAAIEVAAGSGYCLHLINCFEHDGHFLTVDILELVEPVYPEYQPVPDLFPTVTSCQPTRYLIDLAAGKLVERRTMDYNCSPDFPNIDPRLPGKEYTDFWMLGISNYGKPGRKFFDQLAHGSWKVGQVDDIYQTAPGVYLGGEPNYVEGYVIVEQLDARDRKASILLFEAANVAKGPVLELPLRHPIHLG
ncbi:MAG: carotenoid oxygenase family protein, partial [Bryobacteraceae bacterium]